MAEKKVKINLVEVSSLQDLVFMVKEAEIIRGRRGREFFRRNDTGTVETLGRVSVNERDEIMLMGADKKVYSSEREIMRSKLGQALQRHEVVATDLYDRQMLH